MTDQLLSFFLSPAVAPHVPLRDEKVLLHEVTARSSAVWEPHVPLPTARAVVDEYAGGPITRADLGRHAAAAFEEDSDASWVRCYMACQLWGVGKSGRVHWTAKTLNSPEPAAAFRGLAATVKDGDAHRAEGRWAPGWSRSFTTKFAYAVALALDGARPRALVYDDRVIGTLKRLEWSFPEAGNGHRTAWRQYQAYLEELHRCAAEVGCRPDTLEWILFDPPGTVR